MSQDFEKYLTPANMDAVRCIDERPTKESFTAGIQIPGGIYGLIDAVKELRHMDEQSARDLVVKAGIPLDAHTDEHHGAKGCGYAKLVESDPQSIRLSDAVNADDRITWISQQNGQVLTYIEDHKPVAAVINQRDQTTFNSPAAWKDGKGTFNLDVWAMKQFAPKLGVGTASLEKFMTDLYINTVKTLTNSTITQFPEIT